MQFTTSLHKGHLIKRYKRFLADVELEDGSVVTAHCPNTGAMTGCAEPGYSVWLRHSADPKRKLAYTWELAKSFDEHWIGINTHNANKLCVEAIQSGKIPELSGYSDLATEKPYGNEKSRIDILLSDDDKNPCYVEVKSVTLLCHGQGLFPDAKTTRGAKHLRELIQTVQLGYRAVLLFCAQHTGIHSVSVASDIDPEYAELLHQAVAQGVEVLAYGCLINKEKIVINQQLAVNLENSC